ncbi:MAG: pyridoxal phosphate-dependent aminotransferase [Promethearchaeota archaeon]
MDDKCDQKNTPNITSIFQKLSSELGSHSPTSQTLIKLFPELKIRVDACFPINPYAMRLFYRYLQQDLIETDQLIKVIRSYPSQNQELAKLVARRIDIPAEWIFLGNGATEIIQGILNRFVERKILINLPTFSPYYEFLTSSIELKTNILRKNEEFRLNINRLITQVNTEQVDTVVLINPNNPDGNFLKLSQIENILENLRQVKTVIIDESFIHFACPAGDSPLEVSALRLINEFKNIIIIKSMSKDYGIPGIRIGYAILKPEYRRDLLKVGYLWNVSGLAGYFLQLYNRNDYFYEYEKMRCKYIKEIAKFFAKLKEIPTVKVYNSRANFVLIELLNEMSSMEITERLLFDYGVYVRNCNNKWGLNGEFIRIAAGTHKENEIVFSALQSVLNE